MLKIVGFFLLLNWSLDLSCQDGINISFGESIQFPQEYGHYQFFIVQLAQTCSFEELKHYKFNHPGQYSIYTKKIGTAHSHTKSCHHEEDDFKLPDSFTVYVDSIKIEFIPTSLSIEKPVFKNHPTDGNSVWIEAMIENYYKNTIKMNDAPVHTAGIGSKIIAKLDDSMKILTSGKHKLKYNLSGLCTEVSHIQFDFLDHVGKSIPIGLTEQIIE